MRLELRKPHTTGYTASYGCACDRVVRGPKCGRLLMRVTVKNVTTVGVLRGSPMLNVDDEDLEREISEIIEFLGECK